MLEWDILPPAPRQGQSRISHPSVALCARTPDETVRKRCLIGVNEGVCDAFLVITMNLCSTAVVSAHICISAGERFPETSTRTSKTESLQKRKKPQRAKQTAQIQSDPTLSSEMKGRLHAGPDVFVEKSPWGWGGRKRKRECVLC